MPSEEFVDKFYFKSLLKLKLEELLDLCKVFIKFDDFKILLHVFEVFNKQDSENDGTNQIIPFQKSKGATKQSEKPLIE